MLAADRRMGIVSILVACGHATTRELVQEFGVSRRTIMHDISHLSYGCPIYTKQGAGGVKIRRRIRDIVKAVLKKGGYFYGTGCKSGTIGMHF